MLTNTSYPTKRMAARLKYSKSPEKIARKKEPVSRGKTFWYFLPTVLIVILATTEHLLGVISTAMHLSVSVPTYFFLPMCVHDAIHRAAHQNTRLNAIVGWIGAAAIGLTYPVIRRSHLKHHVSHGHGHDDDVESFVYDPQRTLLVRLLIANWMCYTIVGLLGRRDRFHAILFIAFVVAVTAIWPQQVFWSWLLPMQIGSALFAFVTVYLPHGRFATWIMRHAPGITGFHDDHHEKPQFPWYQYFSMRRELRNAARRSFS